MPVVCEDASRDGVSKALSNRQRAALSKSLSRVDCKLKDADCFFYAATIRPRMVKRRSSHIPKLADLIGIARDATKLSNVAAQTNSLSRDSRLIFE